MGRSDAARRPLALDDHYRVETAQTFGIEFWADVFFAQDGAFRRNFLGRTGWLDRVRIGIVDYERMLFLGRYES